MNHYASALNNHLPPEEREADRALQHYFQTARPSVWPPAPTAAQPAGHANRTGLARLTLAASLAGLLALGWMLSYGPSADGTAPSPAGPSLTKASADGANLQKRLPR